MKTDVKDLLQRTPYRISRRARGTNRFSAIEHSLQSLRGRGFTPLSVIDAGANVGDFAMFVLDLFPQAVIHAIEPQPGCAHALERLCTSSGGRLVYHPVALCEPGQDSSTLLFAGDANSTSTGAHVVLSGEAGMSTINVPCMTLDHLFANVPDHGDMGLLKLDLQGYELHALRGAERVLASCDVVLTEVSFYAQAYEPPISELIAFMAQVGFELHDIAAIYARPRDDRPRQGDFIFVRNGSHLAVDTAWA